MDNNKDLLKITERTWMVTSETGTVNLENKIKAVYKECELNHISGDIHYPCIVTVVEWIDQPKYDLIFLDVEYNTIPLLDVDLLSASSFSAIKNTLQEVYAFLKSNQVDRLKRRFGCDEDQDIKEVIASKLDLKNISGTDSRSAVELLYTLVAKEKEDECTYMCTNTIRMILAESGRYHLKERPEKYLEDFNTFS